MTRHDTQDLPRTDPHPELDIPSFQVLEKLPKYRVRANNFTLHPDKLRGRRGGVKFAATYRGLLVPRQTAIFVQHPQAFSPDNPLHPNSSQGVLNVPCTVTNPLHERDTPSY